MIIEKKTGKDLTYKENLFLCFYDSKLKIQFCSKTNGRMKAGLFAASKYPGFGATSWDEFEAEIKKRKLIHE